MTRFVSMLAWVALAFGCSSSEKEETSYIKFPDDPKPAAPPPGTREPAPAPPKSAGTDQAKKPPPATPPKQPAQVAASGDVKPPSTGKEMPADTIAMTPAQAQAVVAKVLERAAKSKAKCADVADALEVALPTAYPKVTAEALPAYRVLQRCALEVKRWRAAIQAGVELLVLQPDNFTIAQIVRAHAELGEYDRALRAAKLLGKRFPAARESLIGAMSYVYCKAEAWKDCAATAEAALAYFTKQHLAPTSEGMLVNRILRDTAWVVLGKAKAARDDIVAMGKVITLPNFVEKVKADAELTLARGFHLDTTPLPQLATGVYHLMGKADTGALVTIKLHEHTGKNRTFRIEAEVPGVTEKSSNSFTLAKRGTIVQLVNPPLKMDFDGSKVRSPRPSQLVLKLVELDAKGDRTVIDETVPIEVLPRDYLPLHRKVGSDSLVPTFGFVGAWITSNDKTIDAFLGTAKARIAGHSFVGEQDVTVPQIQALYDELKAKGVSYVMDPNVTSEQAFVQRTRLPAEVLTSTNAQCLEGTLLFATLMESIGIKPIIVLVPGHAFVGWHTVPKDGTEGRPLFVETTMVGGYSFKQAVEVATRRVEQELAADHFKTGVSTIIDVAEIRKAGFTAQPL